MKLLFLINLLAISFLLQGCKTLHPMKMSTIASAQQEEFIAEGKETVSSRKTHYVSLAPYREYCSATGKTSYVLFVQNMGRNEIEFGPQNINIEFHGQAEPQAPKPISIQSYNEILGEIETNERNKKNALSWAATGASNIITAVTNFATNNTNKAEQKSKASNTSTYVSAFNPEANGNLSPDLVQKNDESFRHYLNQFSSQAKSKKDILNTVFMNSQTIMPGQYYGGLIVSNTKEMNHTDEGIFTMTVMVDNEAHVFSVNRHYPN